MALDLLTNKPSKTKADTASRLVELAGSDYGLKRRIQEAARAAASNGHVDKSTHTRFEKADILKKQRKGLGKFLQRD
jgi:hypothetical protein